MSGKFDAGHDDLVLLGRIGAAHGIRGEVRIQSFTENPLDIAEYGPLLTDRDGLSVRIRKARLSKNVIIATLADVNDRNKAETLNGVELYVPRSALPDVEDEDDFYYSDLIGLDVRLEDGSSHGKIKNVVNYGAGDILEITQTDGRIALLPFTRAIVPKVSIDGGFVTAILPEEIVVEGQDEDDDTQSGAD